MGLREEIEDMKKEVEEIQEESDLYRILKLEDRKNKRLCWLISLLIILLIVSVGYSFYLQNDIGTTITTEDYDVKQDNGDNGNNNFITDNSNEVNN